MKLTYYQEGENFIICPDDGVFAPEIARTRSREIAHDITNLPEVRQVDYNQGFKTGFFGGAVLVTLLISIILLIWT